MVVWEARLYALGLTGQYNGRQRRASWLYAGRPEIYPVAGSAWQVMSPCCEPKYLSTPFSFFFFSLSFDLVER